jgi:hypothetical protein
MIANCAYASFLASASPTPARNPEETVVYRLDYSDYDGWSVINITHSHQHQDNPAIPNFTEPRMGTLLGANNRVEVDINEKSRRIFSILGLSWGNWGGILGVVRIAG